MTYLPRVLYFGLRREISLVSKSSVPEYNKQAEEKGINKTVWKDFQNLDDFSAELKKLILEII